MKMNENGECSENASTATHDLKHSSHADDCLNQSSSTMQDSEMEFEPPIPGLLQQDSSQDSSITNESIKSQLKDKVHKSTCTEKEEPHPLKCKYCLIRLSKLRKLEKIALHKSKTSTLHRFHSNPPIEPQSSVNEQGCQTTAALFDRAEMTQKELRSLAMILRFRDGKPLRSETFCKCVMHGKEKDCRCGEEDKEFEWAWDADPQHRGHATSLQEKGRQVTFHKDYSCGTTAVRGQQPMDRDQYFWEIKMTSAVYGTDMMIGVGTSNVDQNKYHSIFCSMLGNDMESWGLSYDGRIQHGGKKHEYCSRFGQGAIIGVHLDMWHGTLAFFKNRHNLGIAFKNLQGRTLYPMACSTAARSGMRVISCRSFPTSLQFLCCQQLRKFVPRHLSVLDALTMPPGLRAFLANNMTWLLDVPSNPLGTRMGHICDICMPLKGVFEGYTDSEDSSDDDVKADHVHDVINLANSSDEDSCDEFDEEERCSSLSFPMSLRRRYWATTYQLPSGSDQESRRGVVTNRSLCGIKRSRLERTPQDLGDDPDDPLSDEEVSTDQSAGPSTSSSETDMSMPKVHHKLGKRKK